jgi:SAM-dependent methyltransferase
MINNCRMCSSTKLRQFLDLGFTPPADSFLRLDQLLEPETHYPLKVAQCEDCGLAQLTYVVSPEVLYRHDYPYESSITQAGKQHWSEFASTVTNMLGLGKEDLVIDVGSNVGVLLECFRDNGTSILGVDPASNIVRLAEKRGIETWDEFFGTSVANRILKEKGPASVITGTNVFAHVDNLRDFMRAVDLLLATKGIFIFEAPHFGNLIRHLEYDTIYHEHLSYISLKPLLPFFKQFDMEVFNVQERDIHGGSFRVFISRKGQRTVSSAVEELLRREESELLYSAKLLANFALQVEENRRELTWLLKSLKRQGKRVVGVSAPAKGMTLLNYCRIGPEILDFVTEKSKLKIGRFTPGTHIPVVSDEELLRQKPDYALLLAWNFANEIMNNLNAFTKSGGKFIIPIPTPRIV